MFSSFFGQAQKVGRSLMLPVAVLPAAGLMLGVGNFGLTQQLFFPDAFWSIMMQSADMIFGNITLLFVIGVAIGLAKNNDGTAALAAVAGWIVFNAAMGQTVVLRGIEEHQGYLTQMIGINSLNTGIFGSLLIGSFAAYFFNRFHTIKLPDYLAFFAGKRFVPIITAFVSLFLGIACAFVWPLVSAGIYGGIDAVSGLGQPTAFGIYGFVERALIPLGLHHVWNAVWFFEVGSFVNENGDVVRGELQRFFAGDKTATGLGGGFMYTMWALPAAALAMYHCAAPEKKVMVGGLMASAAFTSWLTGITEPVEFTFLFVAPVLYFVHCVLTGIGFAITNYFEILHSTDFAHGALQFFLYWGLSENAALYAIIGPLWAALYYFLFRFAITTFDLKTPGREGESEAEAATSNVVGEELAHSLVFAMGGKSNIQNVDACITRLRVNLKDIKQANIDSIKALGAIDVVVVGDNLQAIFGTQSDNIKTDMSAVLGSS
ncbi:glucose-specific PTS transporter subunit IIBC [Grimontia marina]|uniref:PTS system glucose-specific EIICB component n=1 Tax=Grimontia marina TaxID=646534 RepID=A0A128FFW3_9GAMM|nr:glucose-specific PTS transporter subunit IIBC [Grimontia marina]CZF85161.1 PTS system glucose-specific EIICB component [Grimontia marina]